MIALLSRIARATLIALVVLAGAAAYAWLLRVGVALTFFVSLPYWLAFAVGVAVCGVAAWLITHPEPSA